MRGLLQRALPFFAVLTALALLAPTAPDVLALWDLGHGHDHAHGTAGWGHRSADHARHDASQLEAANLIHRTECALCAGRSRSDDPLLLTPVSAKQHDAGRVLVLVVAHSVSAEALRPSRPRAPPAV